MGCDPDGRDQTSRWMSDSPCHMWEALPLASEQGRPGGIDLWSPFEKYISKNGHVRI